MLLPLEDHRVQAELTEPAERDEPERAVVSSALARIKPSPPPDRASRPRQSRRELHNR